MESEATDKEKPYAHGSYMPYVLVCVSCVPHVVCFCLIWGSGYFESISNFQHGVFEVTATIVLESPLPLTATDKESPKHPWFLYALNLGVFIFLMMFVFV